MPPTMEPSTETTSMIGGTTTFQKRIHSSRRLTPSRSACGMGGIRSGLTMPSTSRNTMYTPASSIPGPTAAANSVPTDSCMMSDSRIRIRLGGMIWPSVPEAQMAPQAMLLS